MGFVVRNAQVTAGEVQASGEERSCGEDAIQKLWSCGWQPNSVATRRT